MDQAAEGAQHFKRSSTHLLEADSWGWGNFIDHERLRARPGYLAGDRLLLRATVEVVP